MAGYGPPATPAFDILHGFLHQKWPKSSSVPKWEALGWDYDGIGLGGVFISEILDHSQPAAGSGEVGSWVHFPMYP
jgi:hypothetical protein